MDYDEKKLKKLVKVLEKSGITIEQMQVKYDISRRTAYRWLDELESRGFAIYKIGTRPVFYHCA